MINTLYLIFLFALTICGAVPKKESPSTEIVIFGATGDLTARKVLPALYNLDEKGRLPENTSIIGVGRKEWSAEDFRKMARGAGKAKAAFEKKLSYHRMTLEEDSGYEALKKQSKGNRLFYLAVPPSQFPLILEKLHANGLLYKPGDPLWSRAIVEKPFGRDLDSAIELQRQIEERLDESQVYRMDHFLGKQGVQNLFSFRFGEGLYEPLWNKEHIESVQITLSEEIGIGERGKFWEETGLLRDIFQNHLVQLVALTAMDKPRSLEADPIHASKIELLEAIRPADPKEFVRGQYGRGNKDLGYRQEKGVPENSSVETFAAAKLFIDNPKWEGVPFYLRAGKRLPMQKTEIEIRFKKGEPLRIRIQPDPAIYVGEKRVDAPGKSNTLDGYERLIDDCLRGDPSLFVSPEEHMAAWRWLAPVLEDWESNAANEFPNYKAGTWGPPEAEALLKN